MSPQAIRVLVVLAAVNAGLWAILILSVIYGG
jgi:hypothetical protein